MKMRFLREMTDGDIPEKVTKKSNRKPSNEKIPKFFETQVHVRDKAFQCLNELDDRVYRVKLNSEQTKFIDLKKIVHSNYCQSYEDATILFFDLFLMY